MEYKYINYASNRKKNALWSEKKPVGNKATIFHGSIAFFLSDEIDGGDFASNTDHIASHKQY